MTAKTEHLCALSNDMRRDIRYAENVVDYWFGQGVFMCFARPNYAS